MLNKELLLIGGGVPATVTFTLEKQESINEGDVFEVDIEYGGKSHRLSLDYGWGPKSLTLPYSGDYASASSVRGSGYITTYYTPPHVFAQDTGEEPYGFVNIQPGDEIVFVW